MSKKNKKMKSINKKSNKKNNNKLIDKKNINENNSKELNNKKTVNENKKNNIPKEKNNLIKNKQITKKEKNIKNKKDIKLKKHPELINNLKNKFDKIKNKFNKIKNLIQIKNKDKKKKEKEIKKLNYDSLSIEQIETELKKETYKSKYFNILSSTIYGLIIVAALSALIATLIMPVFQISSSSMSPKYNTGDIVLSIKTKNIKSGDIIAFYHGNKILVKRVIAGTGNWINIDESGQVYINGYRLEENYVKELNYGDSDIEYPYQVPDGHWFVLSDDRANSIDSRNKEIGSIKQEDIIGKILFKLWDANK